MPHGITNRMNNIRNTIPQVQIVTHKHKNRAQRRHPLLVGRDEKRSPVGQVRFYPKDLQDPAQNEPYVNPARDLKKNRHLRAGLLP